MNNKITLYFNIALLIAVGVLYYLHFSTSEKQLLEESAAPADTTIQEKMVVLQPKDIKKSKIVYVNIDVLSEKYDMLKDAEKDIKGQQMKLEKEYQAKGQIFQKEAMDYQQKAGAGLLSENQAKAIEKQLQDKQQELANLEYKMQGLVAKSQEQMLDIRKKVITYLEGYNKNTGYDYILTYTDAPMGNIWLANDSLDITSEVLDGLNAQYKEGKKK